MTDRVEERIEGAKLLQNDKVILDYILQNKRRACFQTSNEIADVLGVSPSSVVRLSKKMGYENFATFKRVLQKEVSEAGDASPTGTIPYDKIDQYEDLADEEILATFGRNVLMNLRAAATPEMDRKLVEIADMLVGARRVYLVGFRACQGLASAIGVMLSSMRPDVMTVGQGQPMVESLVDMGPNDIMVAISFKRYSKDTAFAVQMAREAGCPVVAMTDSYTAPIVRGAAKTVIHSVGNMSFFDSHVTFMMNVEKVLLLVSKRNKKSNEERLMRMEKYLRETGQY